MPPRDDRVGGLCSREGAGFCSPGKEEAATRAGRETWGRRSEGTETSALCLGDPEPQTTVTPKVRMFQKADGFPLWGDNIVTLEDKAVTLMTEVFRPQNKKPEVGGVAELLWVPCSGQAVSQALCCDCCH